jgi:hypothetical protein
MTKIDMESYQHGELPHELGVDLRGGLHTKMKSEPENVKKKIF